MKFRESRNWEFLFFFFFFFFFFFSFFSTDRSKAVHLLQLFFIRASVVLNVAFVLSLVIPHSSYSAASVSERIQPTIN